MIEEPHSHVYLSQTQLLHEFQHHQLLRDHNENDKRNTASTKTEVIETINEPAYKEKIIDMPQINKAERKPIKIEFSIEDFDQMFC